MDNKTKYSTTFQIKDIPNGLFMVQSDLYKLFDIVEDGKYTVDLVITEN